jgi:hypothetical protein
MDQRRTDEAYSMRQQNPYYDATEMERARIARLGSILTERMHRDANNNVRARLDQILLQPHDGTFVSQHLSVHVNHLTHVILRHNWMRDGALEPVLQVLLAAPLLRELDISETGFAGGLSIVPSFYALVRNTRSLRVLSVSNNDLCRGFGEFFGPALACNTTLEHLNLEETSLVVPSWSYILNALRRHPRLSWASFNQQFSYDPNGPTAEDIALVLSENRVLGTLYLHGFEFGAAGTAKMLRALHQNTSLKILGLGRVQQLLGAIEEVEQAVRELLVPNVTLTQLLFTGPAAGLHVRLKALLERNLVRKRDRGNNARRAVIVLEGLRQHRRLPCMRLIGRDIMRMIGGYILATNLRPEWEDPALWPVDAAGVPIRPLTATEGNKRRRGVIPGTRVGPWVMNMDGEWERHGEDTAADE